MPEEKKSLIDVQQLIKLGQSLAYLRENRAQWRGKRSTLTRENAGEFRQYIETLAASPVEGVTILRNQHRGVTLNTLYQKWMGALQWMIESKDTSPDQRQAAALIKTSYHAVKDTQLQGLRIVPRTGKESTPKHTNQLANKILARPDIVRSDVWKNQFLEWLTAGEVGVPYIMKGLSLQPDDIEFVRHICGEAGIECDVNFTTIKAMK